MVGGNVQAPERAGADGASQSPIPLTAPQSSSQREGRVTVSPESATHPRAIIAGFGLPGRAIADDLEGRDIAFSVIELNPEVIARCRKSGRTMVQGDVRQLEILSQAGLDKAELIALMIPVESVVLEAIAIIRQVRPDIQIIARTHFTSTGLEARTKGANVVIVAEQVVASAARNAVSARLT